MARRSRSRRRRRRGGEAANTNSRQNRHAADHLSNLPDDILRRILFFAPSKEAASTAVLSRRWANLWRTSGAINLDSRSYSPKLTNPSVNLDSHSYSPNPFDEIAGGGRLRRRFLRGAEAALDAACGHVTRLTVHVEEAAAPLLNRRRLPAVFSHPAARRVEEIYATVEPAVDVYCLGLGTGVYKLSFRQLPSENLRVLRITNFNHLKPPESSTAFPRLTELHLQRCMVTFGRLQRIVDAAPQLATLHLEATSFRGVDNVPMARWEAKLSGGFGVGSHSSKPVVVEEPFYRLICPTVTTLIFTNYTESKRYLEVLRGGLEIEAPRLRYIRYHGNLLIEGSDQLLLRVLAASDVIQADLHVVMNSYYQEHVEVPFWQFVHDFSAAKVMRLKMDFAIEDVAIVKKTGQREDLLVDKFFHNLERLELEGHYQPGNTATAVTIANFLRCCPVVRDLFLKLKICPILLEMPSVGTQALLDFNKCIDGFKCRRRAMASLGGDDDWNSHKVSDIPGLSDHTFDCLHSSLRRVGLQFWMVEPNCFGVQLVKFFANNAVFLEEMRIDDGNQMMHEHMNSKIRRWISKRRNPFTVTSFGESCHPRKRQKR
ncbi:unnamed protein product [Urochloa decumbens]|uniref:F-box domain-containing protein n=1 Tax=Urochloa decumbens TaxID=240449 RepID=A0ABC9AHI2_9POAL